MFAAITELIYANPSTKKKLLKVGCVCVSRLFVKSPVHWVCQDINKDVPADRLQTQLLQSQLLLSPTLGTNTLEESGPKATTLFLVIFGSFSRTGYSTKRVTDPRSHTVWLILTYPHTFRIVFESFQALEESFAVLLPPSFAENYFQEVPGPADQRDLQQLMLGQNFRTLEKEAGEPFSSGS